MDFYISSFNIFHSYLKLCRFNAFYNLPSKLFRQMLFFDAGLGWRAIFSLGQELSIKPFSLLSTNPRIARSAYGGSKGRPAGDERHRQK